MDERNIDLWLRWTQSPRIEVIVGPESFLIPQELLRKRSPYFQQEIDKQPLRAERQTISLGDLSSQAFTKFYRWLLSETPSISGEISPNELEDLATLAEKYKVFALQHQVADLFNDKFHPNMGSSRWNLQPDMIGRVYQTCGPASCLRRVFQAALKTVAPQELLREWEEWSKVAGAGGDLSIDLLKAMVQMQDTKDFGSFWTPQPTNFGNPCLFHDHGRQGLSAETMKRVRTRDNTKCLFREVECFSGEFTKEDQDGAGFKRKKDTKRKRKKQLFEESKLDEVPGEAFAGAASEAYDEATPAPETAEPYNWSAMAEPSAEAEAPEPEPEPVTLYDEPATATALEAEAELEPVILIDEPATAEAEPEPVTLYDEPATAEAEPEPVTLYDEPATAPEAEAEPEPVILYDEPATAPEAEAEPEPVILYDEPAMAPEPEPEPGLIAPYDEPAEPEQKDSWGFLIRPKKGKKKKIIRNEQESSLILDPPADTAVPPPSSDEWIKLGEEKDLTA